MRHLFIINPAAGGTKNKHALMADYIRTVMKENAEPHEIYITKAPMDAVGKIRREAENTQPLRVYAFGGDGTLNECVNGAAGLSHVAVTHYPCGTGNDFIKMFGTEDAALFVDLPSLLDGFERPVDIIEVSTASDDVRYGLNICSVGVDARIGADVHKYSAIPIIGGATGYVVSMFINLIRGVNQRLKVTAGALVKDGSFALICACNGRYYGGGFNPVPDAIPNDGILEILLVSAVSRLKFLAVVGKYAKGRYKEIREIITHIRGNLLRIESENVLPVNVDGEILRAKDVTFRIIPGGVNFIFPSGLVFFSTGTVPAEASPRK